MSGEDFKFVLAFRIEIDGEARGQRFVGRLMLHLLDQGKGGRVSVGSSIRFFEFVFFGFGVWVL